jgi:hypothetical protein
MRRCFSIHFTEFKFNVGVMQLSEVVRFKPKNGPIFGFNLWSFGAGEADVGMHSREVRINPKKGPIFGVNSLVINVALTSSLSTLARIGEEIPARKVLSRAAML